MNRGRLKLVIIFAAFLGPLLAAFVWYYGLGGAFATRGTTNHAPLISPVVALQPFANTDMDGARFTLESLKHRWSVIHTLAARCDPPCEKSLYNTRQTRLALGRDINRMQRILLSPNRDLLRRIQAAHPDAILLPSDHQSSHQSSGGIEIQLPALSNHHNIGAADALLVDPLGNLMMIIPADLDPALLLKDLKKLLKLSRIG